MAQSGDRASSARWKGEFQQSLLLIFLTNIFVVYYFELKIDGAVAVKVENQNHQTFKNVKIWSGREGTARQETPDALIRDLDFSS